MKTHYKASNHSKYLIQYHIILTTKYRKPLLTVYGNDIMTIINDMVDDFSVIEMNCDKDHIHILVNTKPHISATNIVRKIKAITTQKLWNLYPDKLIIDFWGKNKYHMFWSPSFFASTIGAINQDIIVNYIKNQDRNSSTE